MHFSENSNNAYFWRNLNTASSFNASERRKKHKASLQAQHKTLTGEPVQRKQNRALYLCLYFCYVRIIQV